ncbi:MAG: ferredoxin III, nif-specific [Rhodocyclaceae bacterium]|jgi:Nif-specific ferredoxin III
MESITGRTRGGTEWTPNFLVELDQKKCIGCGRCFKVCPRTVFELIERSDEMENEDEDWDDDNTMVMSMANALDCIGCGACARVCPKGCHTHAPQPA